MDNLAGPSTSLTLTASVIQRLRNRRQSAELDTLLSLELDRPPTDFLALLIQLEPRRVREEPHVVPVNRFRRLWQA